MRIATPEQKKERENGGADDAVVCTVGIEKMIGLDMRSVGDGCRR